MTEEYIDIESRLNVMLETEKRFLSLLKTANKIEEIVLDEKTQQISATKIREQMRKDGKLK